MGQHTPTYDPNKTRKKNKITNGKSVDIATSVKFGTGVKCWVPTKPGNNISLVS